MQLNYPGLVSALATFLSIWGGHVGVRKIEAKAVQLWPPMLAAILLGILSEIVAARTDNSDLSAACGIVGAVFLWDAFEFYRQENRIKKGYAPANPSNPRHARILAEYPEATTFDPLKRDPRGQVYTAGELEALKGETQ